MGFRRDQDDDWDDPEQDELDGFDSEQDEDEPTIDCPYCHGEIHEDSQRCPLCGEYLSEVETRRSPHPTWIVIGVVVCLIVTMFWALFG